MGKQPEITTEEITEIQNYFVEKYGIILTDEEAKEVYVSLFHLGKAIYRFSFLQKGSNNEN